MSERPGSLSCWYETYPQTVEIELSDESAATAVELVALPLYGGARWACSSRWDDNNAACLAVRERLARFGYGGTFYLNDPAGPWGNSLGPPPAEPHEVLRGLVGDGFTIGGHSFTHPMLTACNQNRVFEELVRIRCALETAVQAPVNSFSDPFCNFADELRGPQVHADLAEALLRAGYVHIANAAFVEPGGWDLPASRLLPPDGLPIDDAVAALLADDGARERNPNLSFCMHAWYTTPEAWAAFEDQLARYAGRPDWWYCDQNAYGAYRLQYRASRVQHERLTRTVMARLVRPALLDLGDPVPLTCELRGVSADRVVRLVAHDAALERLPDVDGRVRFHLAHRSGQRLPHRIGWIANDANRTHLTESDQHPALPGLRGLLSCQDVRLWVELHNASEEPLEDVRITYRTPVAWHEGVICRPVDVITCGERHIQRLGLNAARTDYRYHSAGTFFAAQVDFVHRGVPSRLHLTCRVNNPVGDRTYPQGAFERLGPLPETVLQAHAAPDLADDDAPSVGLVWQPESDEHRLLLDVETVATSGAWRPSSDGLWLLRASLAAESAGTVEFRCGPGCERLWLDGSPLDDPRVWLEPGPHRLVILARTDSTRFRPENAGIFLRLIDPTTGRRATGVSFGPPRTSPLTQS